MFISYKNAINYLSRARSRTAGRPLTSNLRVFAHPDGVSISFRMTPLCIIRSDNTVEFVAPDQFVANWGCSLVQQVHKVLPTHLVRKSRGVYELRSSCGGWEYFNGIKFRFNELPMALVCLNPKLPLAKRIDVEKRLEWRRALRRFKQQVTLRTKLGVVDGLISEYVNQGASYSTRPTLDILYEAIRAGEATTDFLRAMIHDTRLNTYWLTFPSAVQVAAHIHNLCINTYSLELRKKFGVFQGES